MMDTYSITANITIGEAILILALLVLCLAINKYKKILQFFWSALLVIYITLLRRSVATVASLRVGWANPMDAFLNVLLFIPFGFFGASLLKKHTPVLGFVMTVSVECIQYITRRGTLDFCDILFNTLGCAVGYCMARILSKN